jgi:hypothetical protein
VPVDQLHPNDLATATLKGMLDLDSVPTSELEHFRRVYFSMCYEADNFLGQLIDALDESGEETRPFLFHVCINMIVSSRQGRDKHRNSNLFQKDRLFMQARVSRPTC